jgi:acyl carrier protein
LHVQAQPEKAAMSASRYEIQTFVEKTLEDLAQDWDVAGSVTLDSKLFSELGLESLDAVILATSIQEKYGKAMPFAELFAEIGEKQRDLTVSELVDFTWRSLQA